MKITTDILSIQEDIHLTNAEARILTILYLYSVQGRKATVHDVSEATGFRRQSLLRYFKNLTEKGWINRTRNGVASPYIYQIVS